MSPLWLVVNERQLTFVCGLVDVRVLDLRLRRSQVQLLGNNLGQIVHTRGSVTKQYNLVMVKGWFMDGAVGTVFGFSIHLCMGVGMRIGGGIP